MNDSMAAREGEGEGEGEVEGRGWAEMLPEALVLIFARLGVDDMLMALPLVCRSWRRAAEEPACWESVDLTEWADCFANSAYQIERMLKLVVDRSCGRLRDLSLSIYGTDVMLLYIADRCDSLKCLRFSHSSYVTDSVFCQVAHKFPELKELDISGCNNLSKAALQEIGHCCKGLMMLERSGSDYFLTHDCDNEGNEEALTIAKSMPHLKHLTMTHTPISEEGLLALLDGCTHLEYLDVRRCPNLTIDKTTAEKCLKIKDFHISEDWEEYSQEEYSQEEYFQEEYSQYSDDFEEVDSFIEYDDVVEWINP